MTATALRRTATRGLLAFAVLTAPLATAGLASADAGPGPALSAPQANFVDADDWHWWHCHVQHEWWREGCRDWWEDHHEDRDDHNNLPPTGSGM